MSFSNLHKVCQNCKEEKNSTRSRSIYTKLYQGPCGDSFCYASCDMETCRPITATVCDECHDEIKNNGSNKR